MAVSRPNPSGRKQWLPDVAWKNVLGLENFEDLKEITGVLSSKQKQFQEIVSSTEPMPIIKAIIAEQYGEAAVSNPEATTETADDNATEAADDGVVEEHVMT